jgi:hypothetical protein
MADELNAFFAEIAATEAKTAQEERPPPTAGRSAAGADDLASFYAEIAAVEATTTTTTTEPPPATDSIPAPTSPLPPHPPIPPPASVVAPDVFQPLPPPSRPPPPTARVAVLSRPAVITAPPQPATEPERDEAVRPAGPAFPPPPKGAPRAINGGRSSAAAAAAGPPSTTTSTPPHPPGKQIGILRQAAGERWVDATLTEWPAGDFRIFVGNLGSEVNDAMLTQAFSKYSSFQKAKVVRNSRDNKSKGYGFVSLMDPRDGAQALREMHGQYIGHRPVQLKRSKDTRTVTDAKGRAKKRAIKVKEEDQSRSKHQKYAPHHGRGGGDRGGGMDGMRSLY